jgi:ligand-binding sensor domain-containing protein
MSAGRITRYVETPATITRYAEVEAVKPAAVWPGWTNHVSQRGVRALAVAPHSSRLWLATWGGAVEWRRKEDTVYRRYSGEHGLASNAVSCLALAEDGQVWAGHGEGGLSRFTGGRWHAGPDLGGEPVRAVCARAEIGVWAATPGAVYDVAAWGLTGSPVARDHDGAVEADVLLPDGDGVLAGNSWGLFRLRHGHDPERLEPGAISSCTALARDGRGGVWVATPEEVYLLRDGRLQGPVGPPSGEAVGRVLGLAAGANVVWVWTAAGLACVVDGRWRPLPWRGDTAPPDVRAAAASGDDGFLWVGTDQGLAVVWLEGTEATWHPGLLPPHAEDALNNLGRCVTGPTADGTVCVGTAGGLVAFRPDGTWQLDARAGDVRGLCGGTARQQEPDAVYLLTWPHGVGRRTATEPVRFYAAQPEGIPLAVALGQDGRLHALTTRALFRHETGDWKRVAEGTDAAGCRLAQAADGTWWLGTSRGLQRATAAGGWEAAGERPGPGSAEVADLVAVGDTLWVATTAGLWARDAAGWRQHFPPAGEAVVRAVTPAADPGVLWLAGEDRLVRYEPAGRRALAEHLPRDSGLGSARVTALREGAGALWVVTACGTSRLTTGPGAGS